MRSKLLDDLDDYEGVCEKHGPFTGKKSSLLGREIKLGCLTCSDERREAEELREAQEREQQRLESERKRLEAKLGRAAIPERFKGKTFDGYRADTERQQKALDVCKEYALGFASHYDEGRCLMLLGKPGCGKTHLASAIASHICHETKLTAVYRSMPGLVQDIRATYDKDSEYTEGDIISTITSCGLLVLDEVGATKSSEFELALLFTIINGRYEEKLPTLIVSNLAPKELHTAIGDRCVDRLREGGGIVVGFDWESRRGEI